LPVSVAYTAPPVPPWTSPDPILAAIAVATAMAATLAVSLTRRRLTTRLRLTEQLAASTRFADVMRLGADRYRSFFQYSPVPVCALDASRRILAVNDAWLALLGYRREEATGQPLDTFLAPADRGAAEHDWTRLLAGDAPQPRPRRLLRRDGGLLPARMLERIERGPDGSIRRAGAAILEPTPPPAERREALARVVGGIAHDFNNLLMVLMGNLERLTAQAERPDTVRRLAGMGLSAAERGAALTARLLAAAGTQRLRPELVNANRLLREAGEAIAQAAGARIEVQFVLSPVLDPVRLDPERFAAVVLALVANAREAMPRGGRLTIETANLPGVEPEAGGVAVRFVDTGPGMTPEVLVRATEPFFTTRPPGRASGLGLSMADGFARQSGGVLELRSEPGIGTTVSLILPRPAELPLAAPASEPAPEAPDEAPVAVRPAETEE
ncbi:MAG: PAS domain S-box protein, partial [Rhodospirillales bacterium]|nr:PAS domain S-box protein [Rhodospirillales bacterium]